MDSSTELEKSINKFIESKTGEKICIDLSTEHVIQLKPICKQGSLPLGVFWVHVFQHSNNYPIYSYSYKNVYRAGSEFELQLRIEGVLISINLQTGCLTLKGTFVIDWFVHRILLILEAYATLPGQFDKERKEIYTKEQMEALQQDRKFHYKKFIERWPQQALLQDVDVMAAGRKTIYREDIDEEGFLKGQDLESFCPIPDLLDDNETKQQLLKLQTGQVIQGHVLYRLWLSTLNYWFLDAESKIIVCTPHMDTASLVDLSKIFLNNKNTANLDVLSIPVSNLYGRFATVRSEAIKTFAPKDQVLIEYKIYNRIVYPITDFATSFIAMVKTGTAHVLLLNVNFDRKSFFTLTSAAVHYKEMEEREFITFFLDPILG